MILHKDIIQKTPEWFILRKGKMSASNAQAIGNCGKGLESYCVELVAESLSKSVGSDYTNTDIERGNELEPLARLEYEKVTGSSVEEVGFIEYNDYVGCSPDGLVGEDGGIEIKCPNDINYFKILLGGVSEVDTKYLWQVQMNLLVTGRKWWDLVLYNPNYEKRINIIRIYPSEEKFAKLRSGFDMGIEHINKLKNEYSNIK